MLTTTLQKIRPIIEELLKSKYKSFSAAYIHRKVPELTLEEIENSLDLISQENSIRIIYVASCPECDTVLSTCDNLSQMLDSEMYCRECKEEIHIDIDNITKKYIIP